MRVEQGDAFSEVAAAHDEIIVHEHHDISAPQKTEQCIALCTKSDRTLGIKTPRRCRGERVAIHIVLTGLATRNTVRHVGLQSYAFDNDGHYFSPPRGGNSLAQLGGI